jgi:hypothetical protein
MKKEVNWLASRCISFILVELAKKPGTPMDLRLRTGMIKNNYVNIILKRLESEGIIRCLDPNEKIGKVFCIDPKSRYKLEQLFRKKGLNQKINPLPDLNWKAYGILICKRFGRQIRIVFKEAYKLGNEIDFENNTKRKITIPALQKERLPSIATSDIHRAFNKLVTLGLMKRKLTWPREYILTEDAIRMIGFDSSILQ